MKQPKPTYPLAALTASEEAAGISPSVRFATLTADQQRTIRHRMIALMTSEQITAEAKRLEKFFEVA